MDYKELWFTWDKKTYVAIPNNWVELSEVLKYPMFLDFKLEDSPENKGLPQDEVDEINKILGV